MPQQPEADTTVKWPKIQVNSRMKRKGVTGISHFILQVLKSVANTNTCNARLVFYAVQRPSMAHSHCYCLQTVVFVGN